MSTAHLKQLIQKARAANERGQFDEARTLCKAIFKHDAGNVAGLSAYIVATKVAKDDEVFKRIETFAKQTQLPNDLLSQLHFMRGKAYSDMGETKAAFEAICQANALKGVTFNAQATRHSAESLINAALKAPDLALSPQAPRIVFILGMPRSGTSLLAQALGGHTHVQNLGEQTALGLALADPKTKQVDPHGFLKTLSKDRLTQARRIYLDTIAGLRNDAPVLVDKMPENYWLAVVIPMLFPDALIVHMTRDRLATAWSCFRHDFQIGHAYSYDFADCLAQVDTCKALTTAWKAKARHNWYGIALSRLSQNPQREITNVLKRVGLEWQDACLRPQDQSNSVATLSKWQVRQGISPNISSEWEAYEPLIREKWGQLLG